MSQFYSFNFRAYDADAMEVDDLYDQEDDFGQPRPTRNHDCWSRDNAEPTDAMDDDYMFDQEDDFGHPRPSRNHNFWSRDNTDQTNNMDFDERLDQEPSYKQPALPKITAFVSWVTQSPPTKWTWMSLLI